MSRPIITVEGLGKQYAIGTKPSSYQTFPGQNSCFSMRPC